MIKQNRCLEHQQQVVALCIDQNCNKKIKAVCPLELYNEHLNHKFQNISKVHNDWSLYSNDIKQISENVDRQVVLKHMDLIITQFINKIKEHLLLMRKQFEVKMGVYFDSKPVNKIKIALQGIRKCLDEKYLDLSHEEIQNAKFFIEIYGMKKLVNDTFTQKDSFQKEILIAYSKLKQEMFMDYPKFNALFKAKEYEYCDVIKNLKFELDNSKQKLVFSLREVDKLNQENKQLTYQLNRLKNQLVNKDSVLTENVEKLKIITKKYNEQAQQAILKARQIQTKAIFGTISTKNIFRVSDRVVRTGDKQMDWPNFVDIGQATGKIWIRVNRFDVGGWILFGLMHRIQIQKNQYEFDNYKVIGHGTYLMDNNRWVYSDTNNEVNCKPYGFQFGQGSIIKMEVFQKEKIIKYSKMVHGWQQQKYQLKFEKKDKDPLFYCVVIKGEHTQLQLI